MSWSEPTAVRACRRVLVGLALDGAHGFSRAQRHQSLHVEASKATKHRVSVAAATLD